MLVPLVLMVGFQGKLVDLSEEVAEIWRLLHLLASITGNRLRLRLFFLFLKPVGLEMVPEFLLPAVEVETAFLTPGK